MKSGQQWQSHAGKAKTLVVAKSSEAEGLSKPSVVLESWEILGGLSSLEGCLHLNPKEAGFSTGSNRTNEFARESGAKWA